MTLTCPWLINYFFTEAFASAVIEVFIVKQLNSTSRQYCSHLVLLSYKCRCQSWMSERMCVWVECECCYEWQNARLRRSANLFDEPLCNWPIYLHNHLLSIVFLWQDVVEILFEPSQLWSPKQLGHIKLIICYTVDHFRWRYSVCLPFETLCKLRNNHPQHNQIWSGHVSNTGM